MKEREREGDTGHTNPSLLPAPLTGSNRSDVVVVQAKVARGRSCLYQPPAPTRWVVTTSISRTWLELSSLREVRRNRVFSPRNQTENLVRECYAQYTRVRPGQMTWLQIHRPGSSPA